MAQVGILPVSTGNVVVEVLGPSSLGLEIIPTTQCMHLPTMASFTFGYIEWTKSQQRAHILAQWWLGL